MIPRTITLIELLVVWLCLAAIAFACNSQELPPNVKMPLVPQNSIDHRFDWWVIRDGDDADDIIIGDVKPTFRLNFELVPKGNE